MHYYQHLNQIHKQPKLVLHKYIDGKHLISCTLNKLALHDHTIERLVYQFNLLNHTPCLELMRRSAYSSISAPRVRCPPIVATHSDLSLPAHRTHDWLPVSLSGLHSFSCNGDDYNNDGCCCCCC